MTRAHSETAAVLYDYARGEISGEIAVMRLLLLLGDADAVVGVLDPLRYPELRRLASADCDRFAQAAALVASGLTVERSDLPAIRAQFDAAVAVSPEAAVALYSLGSPELLAHATAELAARLGEWRLLGPDVAVLDIGCGIGRLERALAPDVKSIIGIDLSPAMIAEARSRCGDLPNVAFECCGGADLADFAGRRFGLVLAVDAFPYLYAAGPAVAARHISDAARLIEPGGALAIFNFSYRSDLAADRRDVAAFAACCGLTVERNGTRDFTLWDGVTFLLRRAATARSRPG